MSSFLQIAQTGRLCNSNPLFDSKYSRIDLMWRYITIASTALIALITWLIKDIPLQLKVGITILILIALIGQAFTIRAEHQRQQAAKYSGVLRGPAFTILSPSKDIYPKLKLGHSDTFLSWQGPQGQSLLSLFDDNELVIYMEKGRLKLSTQIRDLHGELVAEIIGNEWKLRKDNLWDRNYDKNALEIRDTGGDVILQVVLKQDYVQFGAKMHGRDGAGFGIGSAPFTQEDIRRHEEGALKIVAASDGPKEIKVGDVIGILEVRPPGHSLELAIEPVFRYPSDLHLGERIMK
jgi:hypothetical protein